MFAYCLNNPVNLTDPSGNSAVAEGLKQGLWILPLLDGPIPLFDILTVVGLVGVFLYEQAQAEDTVSNISSESIDWGAGGNNRKNHILKGTGRKHVNGWKRFGIDPDNSNAWGILLPILEEVVDKADDCESTMLPDGSMIVKYFKTYIDQGVQVMVKIWVDVTGMIQEISDAIPYLIE